MLVKATTFVIICLAFVFRNILCRPAEDSDSNPLKICYSLNCPEGTRLCGKHSEVSPEDKTKLNVQIRCYDEDGDILKIKNGTEENPFGPHVYYKGTKFSAIVNVRPSYFYGSDPDTEDTDKYSNNIPMHIPSYPEVKSGPKSEVEDLNT